MSEERKRGRIERLLERVGYTSTRIANQRALESYNAGLIDGEDEPVSGTLAKYGYKTGSHQGGRELTVVDPQQAMNVAWALWQISPMTKRALSYKRDYVMGGGVEPITGDEELQGILSTFWTDMRMEQFSKELVMQLFLLGEQCLSVFVRKADGRVRLGYIDPEQIQMVVTHPDNSLHRVAVVLKEQSPTQPWEKHVPNRVYRIVQREDREGAAMQDLRDLHAGESLLDNEYSFLKDVGEIGGDTEISGYVADAGQDRPAEKYRIEDEDEDSDQDLQGKWVTANQGTIEKWETEMLNVFGLQQYSGTCFFWRVNAVSNQARGMSDLTQVADWMDSHDLSLFSAADRVQLASFFAWDVTLANADEPTVKRRAQEIRTRPPSRGSTNVHNDSETWAMMQADTGSASFIEVARALKLQVLGGLGFPEVWFAEGDTANRATAEAQGDPTWKSLEHDQGLIQRMLLDVLEFVRDQAEIAGVWREKDEDERAKLQQDGIDDYDASIKLPMPSMTPEDTNTTAGMLSTLASALTVAQEQEWMTPAMVREAWAVAMSEIGVDIDLAKLEKQLADAEREEDGAKTEALANLEEWQSMEGQDSYFTKHAPFRLDDETS